MKRFILDASFALCWLFDDEKNDLVDRTFLDFSENKIEAIAPNLLLLEVANSLLSKENRNKIAPLHSDFMMEHFLEYPIEYINFDIFEIEQIRQTARKYKLSAYDANYLFLAIKNKLPLATLDEKLQHAAKLAKVKLIS